MFGGGFGSGFGGGNKLTSFAAPTGDTKLGSGDGAINPLAAPKAGQEVQSDSEGDTAEEIGTGDGSNEVDDRFQHQDGNPAISNSYTQRC